MDPGEGLDDRQLKHLMRTDPTFLGVFPADRLPPLEWTPRPGSMIVNTDPAGRPGEHWVAFRYGVDGHDEFFDSYGKRAKSYASSWEKHLTPGYEHNPRALQGDTTTVCGAYCVYYLHQRRKGRTMSQALAPFGGSKRRNDLKICHWVCRHPRLLGKSRPSQYCQRSVCGRERRCCKK